MGQETRAMGIRPVEICPLVWWVHIFGSNRRVFMRRGVGERLISACVVPTLKHGGECDGDGALLVTLSVIYLEFKAHLASMATSSPTKPKPDGMVSFVFQQDNDPTHDPTHLQAV